MTFLSAMTECQFYWYWCLITVKWFFLQNFKNIIATFNFKCENLHKFIRVNYNKDAYIYFFNKAVNTNVILILIYLL